MALKRNIRKALKQFGDLKDMGPGKIPKEYKK